MSIFLVFQLLSRQDLVSTVVNAFTKAKDEVTLTFELDEADMPNPFALAVVPVRGHKEYKEENADLRDFTATLDKSDGSLYFPADGNRWPRVKE